MKEVTTSGLINRNGPSVFRGPKLQLLHIIDFGRLSAEMIRRLLIDITNTR